MVKKDYIGVAMVLTILIIVLLMVQRDTTSNEKEEITTSEVLLGEARSIEVGVREQNQSGESGVAVLTEVGNKTKVVLSLRGAPDGVEQPAHIHEGSCAELGPPKYPLTFPTNGTSQSLVDASLNLLFAEFPLAVNIHKSVDEADVFVACGDILP